MAEGSDNRRIFSLLEVTASIQKTISMRYTSSFWVKAEMNKLNYYPHSGHCYPDLVEKADGKVVAQMKATLWRDDYLRINRNFLDLVKTPLADGIKMLFCARISFDPIHGLALRITDIDPVFSLGELEREKQESIARLKQEGIFERNKSAAFPLLPKRLAVISVQTSKGYADFLKIIEGNAWGYRFSQVLFPSLLQGDKAVDSMLYQLSRIRKVAHHFDVVAIIRGGGGEVGLSCFNHYQLSREIALFPIPVITGIGHATNETVAEMVAYRNAITPTELADFLIQKFHNFLHPVQRAEELLVARTRSIIAQQREKLQQTVKYFRSVTNHAVGRGRHEIAQHARDLYKLSVGFLINEQQRQMGFTQKIQTYSNSYCHGQAQQLAQVEVLLRKGYAGFVRQEKSKLAHVERTVANMHPANVLRRGYSITRMNGKAVTSITHIKPADRIETILADGAVISEVKQLKNTSDI